MLKVRGYNPKSLNSSGKPVPVPDEADVFKFTFSKDGKDYDNVWVTLEGPRNIVLYYDDDVMDSGSENTSKNGNNDTWLAFVKNLKNWAMRRQLGFELKNGDHLAYDMAQREDMKKQENISEGYYPMGKSASYNDNVPTVKIILQHTRQIQEGEQRYRNVARIFLENTQGERILAPTNKPGIAQVYARHLAEGGVPNDERWNHLKSLCEEYSSMAGFVRAVRGNQFNESAQRLVEEGLNHYQSLRESLGKMRGSRGYNAYFESWTPTLMETEGEETNLNELFVQETLDPRIESVMPILSRLRKNIGEMKEVSALAEWADSITEEESLTSNNPVGIPEGKGDFSQAIEQLSGWDEVEPDEPGTRQYDFDDREGGYYAQGTVVQDLKTGQIKIEFKDDGEYGGHEINDTFNSIGDAMNALRNITTRRSKSGRAQNFDTLGARELTGPDDVYKTDKIGKKGTLKKIRTDIMKASSPYRMRGGPKGVLPEDEEVDEAIHTGAALKKYRDNRFAPQNEPAKPEKEVDESALQAWLGDKKYGEKGMDALRKAGRKHVGKAKMQKIRAQFSNKEKVAEDSHEEQVARLAAYNERMAGENPPIDLGLREVGNWAKVGHYGNPIKTAWYNIAKYGIRNNKFNDSVDKAMTAIGDFPDKYDLSIPEIDALYSAYETVYDQWEQSHGAANENFINTDAQAVTTEEDAMAEAEGVLDAIKKGVAGAKQFGQDVKAAGKEAWDEVGPMLKHDWKHPIQAAMAKEGEMDEGAHTQHYNDANKFTGDIDHGDRPPTDFSADPIEASTDRIHDKISKMLKRLEKPKNEPNMKDTDLGNTLHEVDTGEDDARRSTHKGETTPEQEKEFRKKVDTYGKELEQRQKEKGNVKEGQEDFDAILRIIRK